MAKVKIMYAGKKQIPPFSWPSGLLHTFWSRIPTPLKNPKNLKKEKRRQRWVFMLGDFITCVTLSTGGGFPCKKLILVS